MTRSADHTPEIKDNSVDLIVTSPPFLDVVDYATDNWLRCWFNGIDEMKIEIWTFRKPSEWSEGMERVFCELRRVLKPDGRAALTFRGKQDPSGALSVRTIFGTAYPVD